MHADLCNMILPADCCRFCFNVRESLEEVLVDILHGFLVTDRDDWLQLGELFRKVATVLGILHLRVPWSYQV